jgi:uroporphyrin-III C-methyltransferase
MGVSSAPQIQAGLLASLPASTPVAVIERASLPTQRQCVTTLGELLDALRQRGLGSPAIMVVGDVVLGVRAALLGAPACEPAEIA